MGELVRVRLAQNKNSEAVVFIPSNCRWDDLVGVISLRLGLNSSIEKVDHLILVDKQDDELSGCIRDTETLTSFLPIYQADNDLCFLVNLREEILQAPVEVKKDEDQSAFSRSLADLIAKIDVQNQSLIEISDDQEQFATLRDSSDLLAAKLLLNVYLNSDPLMKRTICVTIYCPWEVLVAEISAALQLPPAEFVSHVMVVDSNGGTLSAELNTPNMFWDVISMLSGGGEVITLRVHLKSEEMLIEEKNNEISHNVEASIPVDTNRAEHSTSSQTRRNSNIVNVLFSLGANANANANVNDPKSAVEVPLFEGCEWGELVEEVSHRLRLTKEQAIRIDHVVLMDKDGDELSPALTSGSKFWKIVSEYNAGDGSFFLLRLSDDEVANSIAAKRMTEPPSTGLDVSEMMRIEAMGLADKGNHTLRDSSDLLAAKLLLNVYLNSDPLMKRTICVTIYCPWEVLVAEISAALQLPPAEFVSHVMVVDSNGGTLSAELNTPNMFWDVISMLSGGGEVITLRVHLKSEEMLIEEKNNEISHNVEASIPVDTNRAEHSTSSQTRRNSNIVNVLFSLGANANANANVNDPKSAVEVPLFEGCEWGELVEEVSHRLRLTKEQAIRIDHVVLMDKDGDELSPALTSGSKFWKIVSEYNAGDGSFFLLRLSDDEVANSIAAKRMTEPPSTGLDVSKMTRKEAMALATGIVERLASKKANNNSTSPKATTIKFEVVDIKNNNATTEVEVIERCSWEELKIAIQAGVHSDREVSLGSVHIADAAESPLVISDSNTLWDLVSARRGSAKIKLMVNTIDVPDRAQLSSVMVMNGSKQPDNDVAQPATIEICFATDLSRRFTVALPNCNCSPEELLEEFATALGTPHCDWIQHFSLEDKDNLEPTGSLMTAAGFCKLLSKGYISCFESIVAVHGEPQGGRLDAVEQYFHACGTGNIVRLKSLVRQGVNVHAVDSKGLAAIHHASLSGFVDIIRFLVKLGLNVDLADANGMTAAHFACDRKHVEAAEVLVELGANMQQKNKVGLTPLHYICLRGLLVLGPKVFNSSNINLTSSTGKNITRP